MPGNNPSLVKESLWHTPHACTLIRTCVAPDSGYLCPQFQKAHLAWRLGQND
jgi:hypothetical protein